MMQYLSNLQLLLKILEAIAALTGFIYWKKIKQSYWKWFPIYLLFIVIAEFLGHYLNSHELRTYNKNLYHYLVIPLEYCFLYWLFYKEHHSLKKLLLSFGSYGLIWIVDTILILKNAYGTQFPAGSLSMSVGNLILLILVINFFIKFLNTDRILQFKTDMMFWVCLGILIFYLGTFPYFGLRNILFLKYKALFWNYTYLFFILNYIMYLLFAISFIWGKPNSIYSYSRQQS